MRAAKVTLGMLVVAACVGAFSGCAVYVPGPAVGGEVIVAEPPPAPIVEVVPAPPGPGFIWIGGCWTWSNHWVWAPGRWAVPPRPRSVWVAPRWEHGRRGWSHRHGHWR